MAAIPKEALAYVEKNQNRFIVTTQNSETMRISADNSQLELGNPYIIYLPYEVQDEAYFYPMIDTSTKKVVSVVGIIGTDQGYVYGTQMYAESYDRVVPIGEFSVLGK